MGFLFPLIAILSGTLAASSLVIEKLPDAESVISKLKRYEAMIGFGTMLMAAFNLFNLNFIFKMPFIKMSVMLGCMGACIVIGFLLGYPMVEEMILNEMSEENRTKGASLRKKLLPFRITGGLVAMGTGLYLLIF